MSVKDCPFCHTNWKNLSIVASSTGGSISVIRPLNPVTEGHVLIIHAQHADSVAERPGQAAALMEYAAKYVREQKIDANIITSIGDAATQTVKHTHIHVVPRTVGDGIKLPWTGQKRKAPPPTPQNPTGWGDDGKPVNAVPAGAGWGEGNAPARVTKPGGWG